MKPSKSTATSQSSQPRKVPLQEATSQIQMVEALMGQLEALVNSSLGNADEEGLTPEQWTELKEQKQQAIALELQQIWQESKEDFGQAINRMLNRAAYETRNLVGQEAIARYHRAQANTLSQEVTRRRGWVQSIKQTIANTLQGQQETKFVTVQHKMHLSTTTGIVIDQEAVPALEGILALNDKYPGILRQLKFNERGVLVDVEFSHKVLANLLKSGDEEMLEDLHFAILKQTKFLVVPTISESKMRDQVQLTESEYGVELT